MDRAGYGGLDVDMVLALEDGSAANSQGEQDQPGDGAGERLLASRGRMRGPDAARAALHRAEAAARSCGWSGSYPAAYLVPPGTAPGEEAGREFALQGSAADAVVEFPGADAAAMAAHAIGDPPASAEVLPMEGGRGATVRIAYLASGPGADGFAELSSALIAAGADCAP